MKKVSIIIPVYNGADYLAESIESALSQTYNNIEVIVVNDGSNDNGITREIALKYEKKIRYFEKENGGVSTALNLGIEMMEGEYFSWLSHDDVYLPTKIEKEMELVEQSGRYDMVVYSNYNNLIMPQEERVPRELHKYYSKEVLTDGLTAVLLWLIYGCTLLIPKSYFEKYGGFDVSYRGVQDYLKWFEMFWDKKMLFAEETLVMSRVHDNQQGNYLGDRMKQEVCDMHLLMMEKIMKNDVHSESYTQYELMCMLIERALYSESEEAVRKGGEYLKELEKPYNLTERQFRLEEKILGSKKEMC